jgi:hypothetical protein
MRVDLLLPAGQDSEGASFACPQAIKKHHSAQQDLLLMDTLWMVESVSKLVQ